MRRGAGEGGRYVLMSWIGSSNRPGEKLRFSSPSYSNLESMIWSDEMQAASSGGASGWLRARNTGLKLLKGTSIVVHSPFCTALGLSALRRARRREMGMLKHTQARHCKP